MGNKKLTRVLALCMAVVCTLTVAAAISYDQNGDGKVTVLDLQALLGDSDYEAALGAVLGGGDELSPNDDGQYEIWSELGLRNFVRNADQGLSFKLMADIDLEGANWTPVEFFGNFDGNGHSIKNVTITKDVNNRNTYDMGFFAAITQKDGVQSEVSNLNLENVNLTAADNTVYMGLLAGSNWGIVTNCTATGSVTDNRTELTSAYVGALVGRNTNASTTSNLLAGKLYKGDGALLTATAGTDNTADKVEYVSAKLATFYAEATTGKRYTGIAGFSVADNMSSDMIWQDTSNSTAYTSEAEQTRRATVEQEMYKMGTVQWTPSQDITFTRFGDPTLLHSNAYLAGRTYTGIPYVGSRDGSYDRFMSMMVTDEDGNYITDANGNYITVTGLEDGAQTTSYTYEGFVTMMGNNCTWAVLWPWATVSSQRVKSDDGSTIYGGICASDLDHLIPTAANTDTYGVITVGNYTVADGTDDTQSIIDSNGVTAMAECYAQARKGDAIIVKGTTLNNSTDSHSRMLSQDPVIIRKGEALTGGNKTTNTIDLDQSYILFHGQGDGLSDKSSDTHTTSLGTYTIKYTSWRLNHKVTLNALLTEDGARKAADGSYWGFIPVTMRAFSWTEKTPYYNLYGSDMVTMPNAGKYYSNYYNVGATMVIKDASGEPVYNKVSYVMVSTVTTGIFYQLDLSTLFSDATENLTPGETYTATLKFKTANGTETVPYVDKAQTALFENYEFTYTAS